MPSDSPFPVPDDENFLTWAQANKAGIIAIVEFNNRVKALQVAITLPGTAKPYSLIDSADNAILSVGVKFATPVAAPSGGATVDTQCRAQLALLLTALAVVGMNS